MSNRSQWSLGITGGSGFVGSSLAEHLCDSFNISLLDVRPPSQKFESRVSFHECDIRNPDEVRKSLEGVDLVIHTAVVQIPAINEQKKLAYDVNFAGTANVCRFVDESPRIKGLILAGSWHTAGESDLRGVLTEEFGFRPDKVEERARLYALSKIAQECIVRFHDEMSQKVFAIVRMGTVLGEGMPAKTLANIFIENGLEGKPLTPFRHSMFRPMLYVDIRDICKAYENLAKKILNGEIRKGTNSLAHVFNVFYPEPVTVIEVAGIVRDAIIRNTNGSTQPRTEVVNTGQPVLFHEEDKKHIVVDISKATEVLQLGKLRSPRESIEDILRLRMSKTME